MFSLCVCVCVCVCVMPSVIAVCMYNITWMNRSSLCSGWQTLDWLPAACTAQAIHHGQDPKESWGHGEGSCEKPGGAPAGLSADVQEAKRPGVPWCCSRPGDPGNYPRSVGSFWFKIDFRLWISPIHKYYSTPFQSSLKATFYSVVFFLFQ